jgi:hypothetical protein
VWNAAAAPVTVAVRLWRSFRRAARVTLAEEELEELARDTDRVTLDVPGWKVVTLQFEF